MSDILRALRSPKIFKPAFPDLSSWHSWEVFLAAVYGLPIAAGPDHELLGKCTGRQEAPAQAFREVFCVSGRRSGKSRIAALCAVWQSVFQDWTKVLGPGERGKALIIATDRAQAKVVHGYVSGLLHSNPNLERLIVAEGKESIELSTGVDIEIATASYRGVRGRTVVFACLEELAFWRSSEVYANPAEEIYRAVKPSLATAPGSLLLGISSAYSRQGLLWEMVSKHHGKDSDVLAWVSDSLTMNPTLSAEMIDRELEADPTGARAEWLSVFRDDVESFLGQELLRSAIVPGRVTDVPLGKGVYAVGFIDPSGGRADSYTAAVASAGRDGRVIVHAFREARPPFSPEAVTREFAEFFKGYRISGVISDRWGGEWVHELWRKHGVTVTTAELTASDYYLTFLALISSGKVELPDNPRMTAQFLQLERRVRPGGKDQVSHPPGLHDDIVNAIAGATVLASSEDAAGPFIAGISHDVYPHDEDGYTSGGSDGLTRRMIRAALDLHRR
jgi:hypothetical protein